MGSTIMQKLREATAGHHARTEEHVALLRPDSGLADYRRYLETLHAVHEPLEAAVERVRGIEEIGLELPPRRKAPLLARDLQALGSGSGRAGALPPLPDLERPAQAFGVLYVLEGSTLGGQVLRKQLEARLPELSRLGAMSYLTCYGPLTGRRWQEFRAAAERYLVGPERQADAVTSAVATFSAFEASFAASARHRPEDASSGGSSSRTPPGA